jgi:hypothetical protein
MAQGSAAFAASWRTAQARTACRALALGFLAAALALPPGARADTDLVGDLTGVLDAELAACEKIKQMNADELAKRKAELTGGASEADIRSAERALEEAKKRLAAHETAEADAVAAVELKARSDAEYRQGQLKEILAVTKPIDERIKAIDDDIARLNAAIAAIPKDNSAFGIGKEASEEKTQLKKLTEERAEKVADLAPHAAKRKEHQDALDAIETKVKMDQAAERMKFQARIKGARGEVDRAAKKLTDLKKGARSRDEVVTAQLQQPGLLECIKTREAELAVESGEGLGTGETSATSGVVLATGGAPPVEHAPGSQPFSSAGLEGRAWPGTWEIGCTDPTSGKVERENGAAEFQFAGNKATLRFKKFMSVDGKDTIEPQSVELDSLGAFAFQINDTGGGFGMSGQFQLTTGADGSARPTGSGKHNFAMDLSWLAGLVGSIATFGLGDVGGVEMTPEEREANMMRCDGTWNLPPG